MFDIRYEGECSLRIFGFFLFALIVVLSWVVINFPNNTFDLQIVKKFQYLHSDVLSQFAQILALLGSLPVTMLVVVLLIIYSFAKRKKFEVVLIISGLMLTTSSVWFLKWIFARPRPFIETSMVETYGSSFPSAHSAYAMMIACLLIMIFSFQKHYWIWCFAIFWAVIMGCSRIYLGVHYLTDVLAGWSLAGLIMLTIHANLYRFGIMQQNSQKAL